MQKRLFLQNVNIERYRKLFLMDYRQVYCRFSFGITNMRIKISHYRNKLPFLYITAKPFISSKTVVILSISQTLQRGRTLTITLGCWPVRYICLAATCNEIRRFFILYSEINVVMSSFLRKTLHISL